MRIATIAGTRPEAIKLAPLVERWAARADIAHHLVVTGQQPGLCRAALAEFRLAADHDLSGDGESWRPDRLAAPLGRLLIDIDPDLVVVQGDTSSAWAGALTADRLSFAVAHVEAGLRSGQPLLPYPEERNRREIDAVSRLLFAPCRAAADNLAREGVAGEIHVTGNTGIDALLATRARQPLTLHDSAKRLILATCHRREARGQPVTALCEALLELAKRPDVTIVLPVHPHPGVAEPIRALLSTHPRIALTDPLGYGDMIAVMDRAHLLLTDSGGLQEEAPALGLPTLVLRPNSERPEAIDGPCCRLVDLDATRIAAEASRLLDDPAAHAAMARPCFPYGRGDAAPRIVTAIDAWWDRPVASLAFRRPDPHWDRLEGAL